MRRLPTHSHSPPFCRPRLPSRRNSRGDRRHGGCNPNANLPFGATSSAPVSKWTPPASAGRQLTLNDLLTWKGIRSPALSNDGKWFAYVLAPNEGDAEVVVRATAAGAKELRFPIGDATAGGAAGGRGGAGGGGASPSISGNNKWVAFLEYASGEQGGRGGRGGRAVAVAGGAAGGARPPEQPEARRRRARDGTRSASSRACAASGSPATSPTGSRCCTAARWSGRRGVRLAAGGGWAARRPRGRHDARAGEPHRRHAGSDRRRVGVCVRRLGRLGRLRGERGR